MRWIIKIILFPISLSSKLLKAKEQMKGQDKSQEITKLKREIEERKKTCSMQIHGNNPYRLERILTG